MPASIVGFPDKRGSVQCMRCQGFRHSSQYCTNPAACARCGRNHCITECPQRWEVKPDPPTCVNCGGRHRAYSAACPALQKEVQRTLRPPAAEFVRTNMVEGGAGAGLMAAALGPGRPPRPRRRRRGGRNQ